MGNQCCAARREKDLSDGTKIYTSLNIINLPPGVVGLKLFDKENAIPSVDHSPMPVLDLVMKRRILDLYRDFLGACAPPPGAASSDLPGVLFKRRERAIAEYGPQFAAHRIDVYLCNMVEEISHIGKRSTSWLTFVDRTVDTDYVPEHAVRSKGGATQSREVARFRLPWQASAGRKVDRELPKQEKQSVAGEGGTAQAQNMAADPVPVLAGTWLNTSLEGDMDKFMMAMGISEKIRKAAATANYGVGKQLQEIAQSGNEFEIKSTTMKGDPVCQKFVVGSGQPMMQTNAAKVGVEMEPSWVDGKVLEIESKTREGVPLVTRRYLREAQLIMEQELQGVILKRVFTKQ